MGSRLNKSSWLVLWVAFSAGVVATLAQFSIAPILPSLQAHYHFSYANGGLLVSLFALATLLSAVPAGFIVPKYGVRIIGVYGLSIMLLGVLFCLYATSFPILLTGRIIEGIGFGLVSVAAPSAIGQYVDRRMLTIAMGIWSTWIPAGSLIMFIISPRIYIGHSTFYWILLMILLAIDIIVYAKLVPHLKGAGEPQNDSIKPTKELIRIELSNRNIWIVAGTFTSFTFCLFAFTTWISTYLVQVLSMSLASASVLPSVVSFLMVGSNLYGGLLLHKLRNNLITFAIPPLLTSIIWLSFIYVKHISLLYVCAVILGLVAGVIPTIIFASVPLMSRKKETIGIAMAIIIIGENAGILIGPEVFGYLRDLTGHFAVGFWCLFLVGLYNLFSCLMIRRSGIFK